MYDGDNRKRLYVINDVTDSLTGCVKNVKILCILILYRFVEKLFKPTSIFYITISGCWDVERESTLFIAYAFIY